MIIEGVIPIHKPVEYTSHDVVAVLRGVLGMRRIGHTGTLDPMVNGVLPVCIGRGTRLVEYIQDLPKEYVATMRLGVATTTEDASGEIIASVEEVSVTEEQIRQVMMQFVGTIEQIPPMYSAVKVDGQRLYHLARQGLQVERKPRKVNVHHIELINLSLEHPNPEITFRVLCSKGTYIRTLCTDIGQALGYPALMSALTRTATGPFQLSDCLTIEQIRHLKEMGELSDVIVPLDEAVAHLPAYETDEHHAKLALQGQQIDRQRVTLLNEGNRAWLLDDDQHMITIRLYAPNHYFLGLYTIDHLRHIVKPSKVFGSLESL